MAFLTGKAGGQTTCGESANTCDQGPSYEHTTSLDRGKAAARAREMAPVLGLVFY